MENINVLSLFSGIGAFEKSLDRKGIGYNLVNYLVRCMACRKR